MKLENEKSKNTFVYAIRGLKKAIKTEKNLKIDCIMAILVVISGIVLKINTAEWIICILLIGIVISAELMNTAIEAVVDMYTREKNTLAERAKDVAAGSVFVVACMSAIVGLIIFIPKIIIFINEIKQFL